MEIWNNMENKAYMRIYVKNELANSPIINNWSTGSKIVIIGDIVYSYNTPVALYRFGTVYAPQYHSVTTSRHINKVAARWNVPVVQMWKWN